MPKTVLELKTNAFLLKSLKKYTKITVKHNSSLFI